MRYGYLYEIKNKINNKKYIGMTFQKSNSRWNQHKSLMKRNNKKHLYASMNKYGIENFEFTVLMEDVPENYLGILEQMWIKELNLQNKKCGYNSSSGGYVNKDYFMPEEVKKNQSIRMTGENNSFYNKHHSEETKRKISKSNTGKVRSEETKLKLSKLHKGEKCYLHGLKGVLHPAYGRERTIEEKNRIQENQPHRKPVVMIDKLTNKKLKTFNSIKEASNWIKTNYEKYNNSEIRSIHNLISQVCRNIKKSAYGFKWMYIKEGQETIGDECNRVG